MGEPMKEDKTDKKEEGDSDVSTKEIDNKQ
jgi:hypothetical protein